MAQPPLLVDQIQVEPGSAGTRLIRRATDGSLEFFDSVVTGGITLHSLAGLSLGGLKIVGKSGAGAEFPTIQAALDCIPATSGPTEPYVILIGPGVYNETLNIVRDWVFLVGMGGAVLEPVETTPNGPGAYHTVVIQADLGTIPTKVGLSGLLIRNYHNGFACVRVVGGAGSTVGGSGVEVLNCDLQATAPGGNRTVWATSVNYVAVRGGTCLDSNALSLLYAVDCASVTVEGVTGVTGVQLDYDSAGTIPFVVGNVYTLSGCPDVGYYSTLAPPIKSTLNGAGEFNILNCGRVSDVTLNGDQTFLIRGTDVGDLTINGTAAVRLTGSRDSVTAAAGASLKEPVQRGTVAFAASLAQVVTLPAKHPDTSYLVSFELGAAPVNQDTPWITAKTTSGFTINFSSAQTMAVGWTVTRPL